MPVMTILAPVVGKNNPASTSTRTEKLFSWLKGFIVYARQGTNGKKAGRYFCLTSHLLNSFVLSNFWMSGRRISVITFCCHRIRRSHRSLWRCYIFFQQSLASLITCLAMAETDTLTFWVYP